MRQLSGRAVSEGTLTSVGNVFYISSLVRTAGEYFVTHHFTV